MSILKMQWPFNSPEIIQIDSNYSGLKQKCALVWGAWDTLYPRTDAYLC